MSKNDSFITKVKIGITVGLCVAVIIGFTTMLYKIYNAVSTELPNKINDICKTVDSHEIDFINYKDEQTEKHKQLNARDDDATDKFAKITYYFMKIDQKLNTQIDFQKLLERKNNNDKLTLK